MRLADFIDANLPTILTEWELFASSLLPAAVGMDSAALRDRGDAACHYRGSTHAAESHGAVREVQRAGV
jgi:hypothetical protein